jgi:purine-binding chemotaxis protein CheW
METTNRPKTSLNALGFSLQDHRYALPLEVVQEVALIVPFTPVGRLPRMVEGLIEYRGQVIPVLDVRAHLGVPARPADSHDHLVIVRAGTRITALRVDTVIGVVQIDPATVHTLDALQLPPAGVAGVARLEDGLILLHDIDSFLNCVDRDILDEWMKTARPER